MKVLIACVGNIFLGDDGFGVEVARSLSQRQLPEGVSVKDYGIRGFDLAYALLDPWDLVIMVDALSRALAAADAIGARAILVHAIDDEAIAFYKKFGFDPSPLDPKQLMLLMKDLRATLKSIGKI